MDKDNWKALTRKEKVQRLHSMQRDIECAKTLLLTIERLTESWIEKLENPTPSKSQEK